MKTITSVSGGKTSSYMALHYPTDYYIFALVRIEDKRCTPKDKEMVKWVEDKIGMEFIATAESDLTLYAVRDLEQKLGKEIIWVTGDAFEKVIEKKKYLPNQMTRFCTTETKIKPIAEFCRNTLNEIVLTNLGIRYCEQERVNYENTYFKFHVGISENGRNKWKVEKYREVNYPLVDNKISHYHIIKWANNQDIIFPPDSNCVGCFWKQNMQLRKNFDDEPLKMQWFMEMEQKTKRRWKKDISYQSIKKLFLQSEFYFGSAGSSCNSGGCTD